MHDGESSICSVCNVANKHSCSRNIHTQHFHLVLHRSHKSLFKYKLSLKELEERENILHLGTVTKNKHYHQMKAV